MRPVSVPRPCAVCKNPTSLATAWQPFVEIETNIGVVRLWLCSPSCAWMAGIHSAPLTAVLPVTLLKLQQLFRGDGVEVVR